MKDLLKSSMFVFFIWSSTLYAEIRIGDFSSNVLLDSDYVLYLSTPTPKLINGGVDSFKGAALFGDVEKLENPNHVAYNTLSEFKEKYKISEIETLYIGNEEFIDGIPFYSALFMDNSHFIFITSTDSEFWKKSFRNFNIK